MNITGNKRKLNNLNEDHNKSSANNKIRSQNLVHNMNKRNLASTGSRNHFDFKDEHISSRANSKENLRGEFTTNSAENKLATPDSNINVIVRVRPLTEKEQREQHDDILQFNGDGQIKVKTVKSGNRQNDDSKLFTYNVVFEPGATQEDIVEFSGIKKIIEMAIEGFSCTTLCYGQTGSGKTYTLIGPVELFKEKPMHSDVRHGLIFRSFLYLFHLIQYREDNVILKASFLEIYNEKVIDLLNPGTDRKPLQVRWSKKSGSFFVENLFIVECEEFDDLLAVLEEGIKNRVVGSHRMNDYSSRSHTILTVHILSEQATENGIFISKHGKINFVDLAGSEITKKTMSEGKTLEEANNINKSLMVLGYCISSLSDFKKRSGHIPYRDSQLTKLLADSLAGNGVTLMIACVSHSLSNAFETVNTLRFASRVKKIRTKPIIIIDPREALILKLKSSIKTLQSENEHLVMALSMINDASNSTKISYPDTQSASLDQTKTYQGSELAHLFKLYMQENQALRIENSQLFTARLLLLREQEQLNRENEQLFKKLEGIKV